jgi:hypothetical protein
MGRLVCDEFGGGVGVVPLVPLVVVVVVAVVVGATWLAVWMFKLLFRFEAKPSVFRRLLTDSIGMRQGRRGRGPCRV